MDMEERGKGVRSLTVQPWGTPYQPIRLHFFLCLLRETYSVGRPSVASLPTVYAFDVVTGLSYRPVKDRPHIFGRY